MKPEHSRAAPLFPAVPACVAVALAVGVAVRFWPQWGLGPAGVAFPPGPGSGPETWLAHLASSWLGLPPAVAGTWALASAASLACVPVCLLAGLLGKPWAGLTAGVLAVAGPGYAALSGPGMAGAGGLGPLFGTLAASMLGCLALLARSPGEPGAGSRERLFYAGFVLGLVFRCWFLASGGRAWAGVGALGCAALACAPLVPVLARWAYLSALVVAFAAGTAGWPGAAFGLCVVGLGLVWPEVFLRRAALYLILFFGLALALSQSDALELIRGGSRLSAAGADAAGLVALPRVAPLSGMGVGLSAAMRLGAGSATAFVLGLAGLAWAGLRRVELIPFWAMAGAGVAGAWLGPDLAALSGPAVGLGLGLGLADLFGRPSFPSRLRPALHVLVLVLVWAASFLARP